MIDDLLADDATDLAANHARCPYAVVATVTNNQDPKKLGRVKVEFAFWGDKVESAWARMATPMAGKQRGMYWLPEVDDEVLVVFAHGDVRAPYVMGALWHGKAEPPETNDDGKNHRRTITSRSGHAVEFDDAPGRESVTLRTKGGLAVELSDAKDRERIEIRTRSGHVVRLSDSKTSRKVEIGSSADAASRTRVVVDLDGGSVSIEATQDIELRAPNGAVRIDAREVRIASTGAIGVQAGSTLDVASKAPMTFSGPLIDLN